MIRVKSVSSSGGILSKLDFPECREFDRTVTVSLTKKQTKEVKALMKADPQRYRFLPKDNGFDLCDLDSKQFYDLTFRVVCVRLSDDSYEYLVTNLLENEFPATALKELYHLRWGIETSFRQLKYTVGLNAFHTKKAEFIRQ